MRIGGCLVQLTIISSRRMAPGSFPFSNSKMSFLNFLSFPHAIPTGGHIQVNIPWPSFFLLLHVVMEKICRFRVSMPYRPYLYLHIKQDQVEATMAFISKK